MNKKKARKRKYSQNKLRTCGLCGSSANLTKTECCGNWICDDASEYELFSYSTVSCYRNHDRYTICGSHKNEGHTGDWKSCGKCLEGMSLTEMYVWYATNEFNFEVLKDPPKFDPTKCGKCERVMIMAEESFSMRGGEYFCEDCSPIQMP